MEFELDELSHPVLFTELHEKLLWAQTTIGWDNFIKGYVVIIYRGCQ